MSIEPMEDARPGAGTVERPTGESAAGGEARGRATAGRGPAIDPAGQGRRVPEGSPASLRALMAEAIDYAGLFPPATLDLPAALGEYERHRRSPGSWMLGRFLVPADRLAELADGPEAPPRLPAEPLRLAVIAGGGDEAAASLALLHRQAEQIRSFAFHAGERMAVEVVETRLPAALALSPTPEALPSYLEEAGEALAESRLPRLGFFIEVPAEGGRDTEELDRMLAVAIHRFRGAARREGAAPFIRRLGIKLRCGGASPAPVPTAERIASLIGACRDAGVGLKFTAGLHHPLRRCGEESGGAEHGFLNVLVAAVLAHARGLSPAQVADCLAEESPEAFAFQADRLGWRGAWASTPETARARREFVTGFGSCSFDDPRAGLRGLGLLA